MAERAAGTETGAAVAALADATAAAAEAAANFAASCAMCASNSCISTLALRVDRFAYRLTFDEAGLVERPPGECDGESERCSLP